MTLVVAAVRNSLTGGVLAAAAILAVGCGSQSPSATGQATSQASASQSSVSSASAPASEASSAAPASQASTAAAGAAACSASNLRITLGNGGAAAGTDFTVLDFTNSGTAPCTLYGFPGVSLINSAGTQIGAAASRNPATASTLVTLAPGGKANAQLGVANAQNYPAASCKPTAASRLKIFPPNQTQPIEVSFTATACAVSSAHQLSISAVAAGVGHTIG